MERCEDDQEFALSILPHLEHTSVRQLSEEVDDPSVYDTHEEDDINLAVDELNQLHMAGQLTNPPTSLVINEKHYTRDETGGYRIYSEIDDELLTDDDADGEPDPEY